MSRHLIVLALTSTLTAHNLTIDSERVTGLPHKNNYCFIHTGRITVTGDQVGKLTCNRLDVHIDPQQKKCSHIVAQNVAWRQPRRTLTARKISLQPHTKTGSARGAVVVRLKQPDGTSVTSKSNRAHFSL